jgi:uncharacterized protein (DUF1800 family)
VVEAILMHPDLHTGEEMVKPPVVFAAGLLRARGAGIYGDALLTLCELAGQRLFRPPNVSGWDHAAWLDTTTMRARWLMVHALLSNAWINSSSTAGAAYPANETAAQAVTSALGVWSNPPLTASSRAALEDWADRCLPMTVTTDAAARARAVRQNALRQLVGVSPDLQVC